MLHMPYIGQKHNTKTVRRIPALFECPVSFKSTIQKVFDFFLYCLNARHNLVLCLL